jgi:hypothetical protein
MNSTGLAVTRPGAYNNQGVIYGFHEKIIQSGTFKMKCCFTVLPRLKRNFCAAGDVSILEHSFYTPFSLIFHYLLVIIIIITQKSDFFRSLVLF